MTTAADIRNAPDAGALHNLIRSKKGEWRDNMPGPDDVAAQTARTAEVEEVGKAFKDRLQELTGEQI